MQLYERCLTKEVRSVTGNEGSASAWAELPRVRTLGKRGEVEQE